MSAPAPAPVTETFVPDPGEELPRLTASRRADGWSAERQRAFLEAISEGHGVDAAARRVGLSATSAYAFRRTAAGAPFALGWRAATLVARDCVAETLLVRALEGQVDTIVRGEVTITRHRHDNRLAMSLLARLDRQVEVATDADTRAARLVAQEFDAFLDLVGAQAGPARAGLFLARRGFGGECDGADTRDLEPVLALAAADRLIRTGVATAGEVAIDDLDPAERASWSAGQWARAEAAGLIALAPPPPPAPEETAPAAQHSQHSCEDERVWWNEEEEEWRSDYPPPPGFDGWEEGVYGLGDYERALSDAEAATMDQSEAVGIAHQRRCEEPDRAAFFEDVAAQTAAMLLADHGPPH